MSLILDALKKLDREKSSRRIRTANIATEILRADRPRPNKRTFLYSAAVAIGIIVTAGITYALMMKFGYMSKSFPPPSVTSPATSRQEALATAESALPTIPPPPKSVTPAEASRQGAPVASGPSIPAEAKPPESRVSTGTNRRPALATAESASPAKPSPPVSASSSAASQQAVPAIPEPAIPAKPLSPAPVSSLAVGQPVVPATPESAPPTKPSPPAPVASPASVQQAAPAIPSSEPVRNAQDQAGQVPPKIPQPKSKTPAIPLDQNRASQKVIPGEAGIASGGIRKPAEQAPGLPAASPPSLKISGIVWSEEPSERRAVINGTFTAEGSLIQGVKVVEIRPTSVRFSHQGQSFEISVFE